MQPGENYLAEDSCFIKHQPHSHHQTHEVIITSQDVEKTGINNLDGPAELDSKAETEHLPIPDEKPVAEASRRSHSDDSTLADGNETEEDKGSFPEGGLRAWLVVFGAFCGSFSVFGIINSTAVLLDYFSANQLKDYSPSQIGWIFGLSLFLTFFCGAPIGPIFDSYGPRALIFAGSILLILSMFLLGECTRK